VLLRELTAFIAPDRVTAGVTLSDDLATVLSPRELHILGLAAAGHDNDAIAAELVLSVRTVERHLQNAYAKLGLHGRTARTAASCGCSPARPDLRVSRQRGGWAPGPVTRQPRSRPGWVFLP